MQIMSEQWVANHHANTSKLCCSQRMKAIAPPTCQPSSVGPPRSWMAPAPASTIHTHAHISTFVQQYFLTIHPLVRHETREIASNLLSTTDRFKVAKDSSCDIYGQTRAHEAGQAWEERETDTETQREGQCDQSHWNMTYHTKLPHQNNTATTT